jgi:hypothetical protein
VNFGVDVVVEEDPEGPGGTGAWSLLFLGSRGRGLALIVLSFLGLPSIGFTSYLGAMFPIASINGLG